MSEYGDSSEYGSINEYGNISSSSSSSGDDPNYELENQLHHLILTNNNATAILYAEHESGERIIERSAEEICRLESSLIHVRGEKRRNRRWAHDRIMEQYFSPQPIFSDDDFRRRFRMRRSLFNTILEAVCTHDNYFVQRSDAAGRMGLSPHLKICAALRYLCYGASMDSYDEHFAVGRSTGYESLKRFCRTIIDVFGPEYLRQPTQDDMARITTENAERGFPGMIGSIDCMHWRWIGCPTAHHGAYLGHKAAPTVILEAVASKDLWIWKAFFGMPGSNNDINVLSRSTVFEDALRGNVPPVEFEVNGNQYNMGYYLADGIYPQYTTLVKSQKNPTTEKARIFARHQAGARKDIERAFGVLQKKFAIIVNPGKLWSVRELGVMIKACIIIHNMIINDERRLDWDWEYDEPPTPPTVALGQNRQFLLAAYITQRCRMMDSNVHRQLQHDLTEHVYEFHGHQPHVEGPELGQ